MTQNLQRDHSVSFVLLQIHCTINGTDLYICKATKTHSQGPAKSTLPLAVISSKLAQDTYLAQTCVSSTVGLPVCIILGMASLHEDHSGQVLLSEWRWPDPGKKSVVVNSHLVPLLQAQSLKLKSSSSTLDPACSLMTSLFRLSCLPCFFHPPLYFSASQARQKPLKVVKQRRELLCSLQKRWFPPQWLFYGTRFLPVEPAVSLFSSCSGTGVWSQSGLLCRAHCGFGRCKIPSFCLLFFSSTATFFVLTSWRCCSLCGMACCCCS